jgi:hypothetical protein
VPELCKRSALSAHRDSYPKIFSSDKKQEFGAKYGDAPLFEHHTTSLVFNDPPFYTRVRHRHLAFASGIHHINASA